MRKIGNRGLGFLVSIGLVTLLGISACRATVAGDPDRPIKIEAHITLDIRQVKEDAHSIEDLVSGKAPQTGQKRQSRLSDLLFSVAWADGSVLSPEVQQAVNARRDRFPQLKRYKMQGLIGEDREGHVAVLGSGSEVKALVDAENRDRETIYQSEVRGKNLPPDAITAIRSAFAEEQRARADAGEKIQLPSGEWKTK